jgi:hypothetical protein
VQRRASFQPWKAGYLLPKATARTRAGRMARPCWTISGVSSSSACFRNATPLKDPTTGEVLGYEAQYVGKANLVRSEGTTEVENRDGSKNVALVPATIDITSAKEEIRVGDRLVPEPPRQLQTYTPRAPDGKVDGRIVSVYGSAVRERCPEPGGGNQPRNR